MVSPEPLQNNRHLVKFNAKILKLHTNIYEEVFIGSVFRLGLASIEDPNSNLRFPNDFQTQSLVMSKNTNNL